MIGEQEEARQAHAAVAAEMTDEAGGEEGPDSTDTNSPGVADLFQPAYIPAVPAMPRATARRGNNALFQKLAAGAGKQSVIDVPWHDKQSLVILPMLSVTVYACRS